jgi:poly-gamma-glutamate synthesis protein (capsule biosynthesis protein)
VGLLGIQPFCLTIICLKSAVAVADVRHAEPSALANLNIRHHLIPGLKLNAKSPNALPNNATAPSPKSAASAVQNQRPAVPPPPSVRRSSSVSWQAACREPVRVSFFGDYWVAPNSPAADMKHSLLDNLRPLLGWADFNVVNFEGSITKAKKRAFPEFPFALKQASDSLKWLSSAGVNHLTRANNHAMDFGWEGAEETSAAIKAARMKFSGIGSDLKSALKPMWLEKNGMKIAVVSVTTTYPAEAWAADKKPGVAFPRADALRKTIQGVRDEADFVVVAFHWGEELKPTLRDHQPQHAKVALDAGADLVVGHHAHVAQKIDVEPENGMIVYGLGNFIFTSLSRDAKFGLGSHFEFCRADEPDTEGATHHFKMVLTPLLTFNRSTGYRSRMMNIGEFLPFAREYVKKGYFSPELEFFVPGEDRVKTLGEWLQPREQASKEGREVR